MLNDFFSGFFYVPHTDWSFYRTIFLLPLIYASLTICTENLLLLHLLIARLSTETAALVSFWFLRRQRFCFWMHSDVRFSSLSCSPPSASPSFVVTRHGHSFIHFSFSSPSLTCHSLTSASHSQCRLVVILSVLQESYKSGYRPARYVTNFLLCTVQRF